MMLSTRAPSRLMTGLAATGLCAAMIASGWAVAHAHTKALLLMLAVIGLLVLAAHQRGALVGVLLIAAMNGLPFLDTSQPVTYKLTVADVAIIVLILVSTVWLFRDIGEHRPTHIGQGISRAALLLLGWWLLTLGRSVVAEHVSALHAASFGRDFLYFALLLSVLPRVRLTSRDIGTLLSILTVAACAFAAGQIATTTGLGSVKWLIHVSRTAQQEGFTRIYADMTDLVGAVLPAAVAAALIARERVVRAVASPVALLLAISVVVQLTRARWIGLIIGLLVVGLWLATRRGGASRVLRRRLAPAVGLLCIAGFVALIIAPGVASGGTFVQRLLSIASDLQNSSGTVAIREAVTRMMTADLGAHWPSGLGFLPPSAHYFQGLPDGSIRDPDLGVLNAVMTMGAIGAVFLYLPALLMLISCLRRTSVQVRYDWVSYGGAVWIVAALVSSPTLVTLFSASGLAMTAILVTVLAHPTVSGTVTRPVTEALDEPRGRQATDLAGRRSLNRQTVGAAPG